MMMMIDESECASARRRVVVVDPFASLASSTVPRSDSKNSHTKQAQNAGQIDPT